MAPLPGSLPPTMNSMLVSGMLASVKSLTVVSSAFDVPPMPASVIWKGAEWVLRSKAAALAGVIKL